MKTTALKFLLVALIGGALTVGCGPMIAPWHPYEPTVEANDEFFNEFYNCVGSSIRSEQMKLVVKAFAPEIKQNIFAYYPIPDVSIIIKLAKTMGTVIASDHSQIEARFKDTLGLTPAELDFNLSACFALIDHSPDAAGSTAEELRLFVEVMQKNFGSGRHRNYDTYHKTYRRYMLALSVLEMGMAKRAGPDPTAVAGFETFAKQKGRTSGRSASALGRAEAAMDATEAHGGKLDGMIDTAVGHSSGSINEDEAKASLLKLDKARARADAGFEAAGEGEFDTAKENVKKAREENREVQATLKAGKKGKCDDLLRDLKEAKTKCDAGKKIFCEAFGEKRAEFIKRCGKDMLPKELGG
jgi:hypothetical protein